MKTLFIVLLALSLSGCAQWNQLSDPEKAAVIVSGAIIVGAAIIRNDSGDDINKVCVSTQSIKTGCGNARL